VPYGLTLHDVPNCKEANCGECKRAVDAKLVSVFALPKGFYYVPMLPE
jgi:hypothetical protein